LDDIRKKILIEMKHVSEGIIPMTNRWLTDDHQHLKSALKNMSPDDRRRVTRRFRKLWRKEFRTAQHAKHHGRLGKRLFPAVGTRPHENGQLHPARGDIFMRMQLVKYMLLGEAMDENPEFFQ
jgi:hypothetical protein